MLLQCPRAELLAAIETVKPAIGKKEGYTLIWFDGDYLTASDDNNFTIRVPLKSDFKGGLQGDVLYGVLFYSRAKEAKIEELDSGVLLSASKTKLNMSKKPIENATYELPKLGKGTHNCRLSREMLDALKAVSVSIPPSNSKAIVNADQLGVTFIPGEKLNLFSTDADTISWAILKKADWPLKDRITVPTIFIEELLKLADDNTLLFFVDNVIAAKTKDGTILFTTHVDVEKPNDFLKLAGDCVKGAKFIDLTQKELHRFRLALERAEILLANDPGEAMIIEVGKDEIRLEVKAQLGRLFDKLSLPDPPPPPTRYPVNPSLIKRGIDLYESISLSENATIMASENARYIIANFGN